MPRIDSENFYTSAIEMYGISAKGVNWNSKKSQHIRFKTILEMLPEDLTPFTVADAGCGFGDLFLYMQKKKKLPKIYTGIDSLPDMFEIASQRTGCEIIIADICKDTLPKADYFVCSGAMNVLEKFETYQFIQNCYRASKIGFIFNILYGYKESQTYNYFTQKKIKQIADELNIENVEIKKGYLKNDITVAFLKKDIN